MTPSEPVLQIRPACRDDGEAAVPLIYSAGPEAFEHSFSAGPRWALEFLAFAFDDGAGFFGWRNHVVAQAEERVVGIGAFYSGHEYGRLDRQTAWQVLRFYPLPALPGVVRRARQAQALMPRPPGHMHYVANLGVHPEARSLGIGSALIRQQQAVARQLGRQVYALDVSVGNPRGQALYERLGFAVTARQHFPGPPGAVPDTRRMEMRLVP